MVSIFYQSRSLLQLLATEHSYSDGNESLESISGALGTFQVGWRRRADTMSDSVIVSIHEIVSKINKAERKLFSIPDVQIDDKEH